MNFLCTHGWKHVATMLLWLCVTGPQMACLLPQDDQLIAPVPPPANRPLRVLPGLAVPGQRETTLTFGANCTPPGFSVKVDDPNVEDKIAALWFIDPIERYIGGVPGNAGTSVSGGSTVREVKAPSQFMNTLRTYTDGRKHRVEGVVKLQLSRLEEAPQLGIDRNAIAGLGRRDGHLYILLDVEQALS